MTDEQALASIATHPGYKPAGKRTSMVASDADADDGDARADADLDDRPKKTSKKSAKSKK
jgi:hypothetical protein